MDAKTVSKGGDSRSLIDQFLMQFGCCRGSLWVRTVVISCIVRSESFRALPRGVVGSWSAGCHPSFLGKVRLGIPIMGGGGGSGRSSSIATLP